MAQIFDVETLAHIASFADAQTYDAMRACSPALTHRLAYRHCESMADIIRMNVYDDALFDKFGMPAYIRARVMGRNGVFRGTIDDTGVVNAAEMCDSARECAADACAAGLHADAHGNVCSCAMCVSEACLCGRHDAALYVARTAPFSGTRRCAPKNTCEFAVMNAVFDAAKAGYDDVLDALKMDDTALFAIADIAARANGRGTTSLFVRASFSARKRGAALTDAVYAELHADRVFCACVIPFAFECNDTATILMLDTSFRAMYDAKTMNVAIAARNEFIFMIGLDPLDWFPSPFECAVVATTDAEREWAFARIEHDIAIGYDSGMDTERIYSYIGSRRLLTMHGNFLYIVVPHCERIMHAELMIMRKFGPKLIDCICGQFLTIAMENSEVMARYFAMFEKEGLLTKFASDNRGSPAPSRYAWLLHKVACDYNATNVLRVLNEQKLIDARG